MAKEQEAPKPEAPKPETPKKILLYSRWYEPIYSKLCKKTRPVTGLKFSNATVWVTPEELEEIKASQWWNKEISDKKFIDSKTPVKVNTDKEK
jgi:hypothetical protein